MDADLILEQARIAAFVLCGQEDTCVIPEQEEVYSPDVLFPSDETQEIENESTVSTVSQGG